MEVNRLDRAELEYELQVRGYTPIPDVGVMRNLLKGLIKTGENNLETFVIQDPEKEIAVCTTKLRELKASIDSIKGDKFGDDYRTASTKLNHLLGRIDRITSTDDKIARSRSLLFKTVLYLMKEMDSRAQTGPTTQDIVAGNYKVTPVTRTLVVGNVKMSSPNTMPNSPVDSYVGKKDAEKSIEIFNHTGVALKKKNSDESFDPVPGTLSIVQYELSGKFIEWKPTDVSFETENTDAEWESVDAVRRRTCSSSSNVEYYNQYPPIKIRMRDLLSYKLKTAVRQVSLRLKDKSRYSFLFQFSNSDGFIASLRSMLVTRRSHKSKHVFHVLAEREESRPVKSFNDLDFFQEMEGQGDVPNIWNFMSRLHNRPYETTMQTFSKLTDTLLYRTPEQRPPDAEVAELLTRSFSAVEDDKTVQPLESEYTIVAESKSVTLKPRPSLSRNAPLNIEHWTGFLDAEGRVTDSLAVKKIVFKGGIDPALRYTVWKYLLNYYPWNASSEECGLIYQQKKNEYDVMKRQWQTMTRGQEERFQSYRDRKNLIEKDVNRTDRTLPYYAGDDNPNLKMLNDVLMTYVMYNFDLGYVQGMSDLLSPILYLMGNEVDAFWCFVGFMDRVFSNFDLDQAGMKKQLSELQMLLKTVSPDLANYLVKHDSGNMFFCFRWLLVHFKREFTLEEIMTLWEVIWTDLPCDNFHLVICAAILDMEKDELMKPGNGFTEVLKYVNELACRMDLNKVLSEAESIFEQLKETGDVVPISVRRIIGLAPEADSSDEESFLNTRTINGTEGTMKNLDEVDSIMDDMEKVTITPETGEIGFEAFERAISSNYY